MKVFAINDMISCKFHLLLGEKEYKIYAALVEENGGEVTPIPEDGVLTFTTSSLCDWKSKAYNITYIIDCIEAGKLLFLGDYTLGNRKSYGCAMSILLFGERHCKCLELLRSSCNTRTTPPRTVASSRIEAEVYKQIPSTSRMIEPVKDNERPSTSQYNPPGTKLFKTIEKRGVSIYRKSIDGDDTKDSGIDPKVNSNFENPIYNKEESTKEQQMNKKERKEEREVKTSEHKEQEKQKRKKYVENKQGERIDLEKRQHKREYNEREDEQESLAYTSKNSENSGSRKPLVLKVARIECTKLTVSEILDSLKSKGVVLESEPSEQQSCHKSPTLGGSKNKKEPLRTKRVLTSEEITENLPENKRLKNDNSSKNEIPVQKENRCPSDKPQESGDFQFSSEDLDLQRRNIRMPSCGEIPDREVEMPSVLTQNTEDSNEKNGNEEEESPLLDEVSRALLQDEDSETDLENTWVKNPLAMKKAAKAVDPDVEMVEIKEEKCSLPIKCENNSISEYFGKPGCCKNEDTVEEPSLLPNNIKNLKQRLPYKIEIKSSPQRNEKSFEANNYEEDSMSISDAETILFSRREVCDNHDLNTANNRREIMEKDIFEKYRKKISWKKFLGSDNESESDVDDENGRKTEQRINPFRNNS